MFCFVEDNKRIFGIVNKITKSVYKKKGFLKHFWLSGVIDQGCLPLHYLCLGCSQGCLTHHQLFRKTSKFLLYSKKKYARYNNMFGLRFMVFNANFNNISVICQSVLLVEETIWRTLSHNVVSPEWDSNS